MLCLTAPTLFTACGASSGDRIELTVMTAASLTEAFAEIEAAFEAANPGVNVRLNIAGSASLREQIVQGAPADVFASANATVMQQVVNAGAASNDVRFASNRMVVAVPSKNPGEVNTVADLAENDLLVGLCQVGVPCGDLAREALTAAGIEAAVDTTEGDVRALLTKIEAGELDAGVVYATDIAGANVRAIDFPPDAQPTNPYMIATLTEAPAPSAAADFVAFVTGSAGQAILAEHGFGPAS